MNTYLVACLPGDGIGPEVLGAARQVVDAAGERFRFRIDWADRAVGGAAIDATGSPLPAETLEICAEADAVLFGAVGGPRWSDPRATVRPEQGLLRLRSELGLFANLRPVRAVAALAAASPLRAEVRAATDVLIVRELTGGLYFGRPQGPTRHDGVWGAVDTCAYTRPEIERVVRLAFELAEGRRRQVTSVDKANVLATSRLWRSTADAVAADHPEVRLEHALVDSFAADLMRRPSRYDVVVTENLFGDIVSDEAAVIAGSLGLLASASLGERQTDHGRFGLFEPVHGSAPDIAGRGVADPVGAIASAALMLRWSLGEPAAAAAIETTLERVLETGPCTPDLGGDATTAAMTGAILDHLLAAEAAMP